VHKNDIKTVQLHVEQLHVLSIEIDEQKKSLNKSRQ